MAICTYGMCSSPTTAVSAASLTGEISSSPIPPSTWRWPTAPSPDRPGRPSWPPTVAPSTPNARSPPACSRSTCPSCSPRTRPIWATRGCWPSRWPVSTAPWPTEPAEPSRLTGRRHVLLALRGRSARRRGGLPGSRARTGGRVSGGRAGRLVFVTVRRLPEMRGRPAVPQQDDRDQADHPHQHTEDGAERRVGRADGHRAVGGADGDVAEHRQRRDAEEDGRRDPGPVLTGPV